MNDHSMAFLAGVLFSGVLCTSQSSCILCLPTLRSVAKFFVENKKIPVIWFAVAISFLACVITTPCRPGRYALARVAE